MAYTHYDNANPLATQTGPNVVDSMRENLLALRDSIVMGALYGWDLTVVQGTGTAEQPQYLKYSRGSSEYLRAELTWGTSGGEDGNVTVAAYAYSTDNFSSSNEAIGTLTISYDSDANVTATAWS